MHLDCERRRSGLSEDYQPRARMDLDGVAESTGLLIGSSSACASGCLRGSAATALPGGPEVPVVVSSTQTRLLRLRRLSGAQLSREAFLVRVGVEFAGALRGKQFRYIRVSEHDDSLRMVLSPVN
jgi:hypothetical protein